jgi:hypothetical protein
MSVVTKSEDRLYKHYYPFVWTINYQ